MSADDETFCPRCFAGLESSEHRERCADLDPMYGEAVEFTRTRVGFSRNRFQRVMHVGFIKRDALLHQMEDAGVIRRASNDADYFLVVANNGSES